jgi:U3 small nucleolar RNA-associated protein 7
MEEDEDNNNSKEKKEKLREEKQKKKMRGKNKSMKRYLRKHRKNVIDPATVSPHSSFKNDDNN